MYRYGKLATLKTSVCKIIYLADTGKTTDSLRCLVGRCRASCSAFSKPQLMAKELPFYKFTATEWLTGDIYFENFDIQGLFISVCATYWKQDCDITLSRLKQRLSNASTEQWQRLIDGNYIKVKNDIVSIKFLDEQIRELSDQHKKKVEAGRKGGQASVKQRLSNAQPTLNHKDIDIEEDKEQELKEDLFEKFWTLYAKGVTRIPSQREWLNIDEAEYAKILEHVPKYVRATPKYRKDPVNYLKDRAWLDPELPKQTVSETEKPKERFVPTPPKYT